MRVSGQMKRHHLASLGVALVLALYVGVVLGQTVLAQTVPAQTVPAQTVPAQTTPTQPHDNAVVSGGAAPGQPTVKVHADGSGALIPDKSRAPLVGLGSLPDTGTPATVSGGVSGDGSGGTPATVPGGVSADGSADGFAGGSGASSGGGAPAAGGFAPQGGVKPAVPVKPAVASGGSSTGALDYQGWERMATRVEAATTNPNRTDVELENLRLELTHWREQLLGAQTANSARITTLKDQIATLGPLPAESVTEAPAIAKRRVELNAQMARLQAPGIAADEAYTRADGLIREIDRVLRERQADELLKLWPNPFYPGNWRDAAQALSQTAVTIWDETAARSMNRLAQGRLLGSLPVILPLLGFAIAVLWRGRYWTDRLVAMLQGPASARGRRIWGFLASLGLIFVPVLGLEALAEALRLSQMPGVVGLQIVNGLGQIGLTLFGAMWLGVRVFPVADTQGALMDLPAEKRAEGRFLTSSFGVLLAVAMLRRIAMVEIEVSDAAISVLSFPIILIGGLVLVRLGQVMRHARLQDGDESRANYRARLVTLLARGVIVIGVVGPVLAAIGYVSAASALIFPAALTLGLAALLYLIQRLVGDFYALVTRTEADQDALAPVLISFGLALATLPVVALIWGARVSDLTEIWTRFQEGFQLGEARISPTVFLFFAVVFAIGMAATRLFQGALKNAILPRTRMDQGGQNALVSGLGYVGILLSALIAINSTGINLSGLAIVAGALSVGIGFGLQTIVSNFVSGIILLIERPISEGDWIEVGPVQGIVASISVRSTRIQTFDRSDVIVPNSDLIAGRVTNWTRFSLTGRLIVVVMVPYTEDSRKVAKILREIAEAQPLVLLSPPPLVAFMGFTGEVMSFEIRVILRDVNFQVEVRTEINHQIAERFRAADIPFTSAQRDYLKRVADEAGAEAEAAAEEAAHIAAVEAILGAPLPATVRRLTAVAAVQGDRAKADPLKSDPARTALPNSHPETQP